MADARRWARIGLVAVAVGLCGGPEIRAQDGSVAVKAAPKASGKTGSDARTAPRMAIPAPKGEASPQGFSIWRSITHANPMLWPLALCSVVTLGFALERLVALRRARVLPRDFVTRFIERLASGKLDRDRAAELCRANDSPAARIFGQVVRYWGQPAASIRQAIGYDASGELIDLKRNIRVLNATATLGPLLGLLGTVVGIIESFNAVSMTGQVGSSRGQALAHGISLALVATALGLGIAVVSVVAYYYLLNRVDVLVRDLDDQTRRVIDMVCAEATRPTADRRAGMAPAELGRHEARIP